MKNRIIGRLFVTASLAPLAGQADTLRSKAMLRNSYGFAGMASGCSDVSRAAPVSTIWKPCGPRRWASRRPLIMVMHA